MSRKRQLPDVPGDPRPKWGSPEYFKWRKRNFENPRKEAEKKELEQLRADKRRAEREREVALRPSRVARVEKFEQAQVDRAHEEALIIQPTRDVVQRVIEKRLDENQRSMSRWFEQAKPKGRRLVMNASRQLGKSWWAVAYAITFALQNPRAQIKYGAPSKIQTRGIVRPHIRDLVEGNPAEGIEGLPMELRPTWLAEDSCYLFKHNGATITIIACDEAKADSITGQHAHLFLIDEAGQIDNLDFIVKDIARPMLSNTRGHMLIFSTPARKKGNSFKSYCDEAQKRSLYCFRDIYDNPRLSDEEIRSECEDAGGPDSTTWHREYLCEHVADEEIAVLPEATAERMEAITISDALLQQTRSPFVDPYVVVKPGWNPNFTGALLGSWDKRLNRIVIENEVVIRKMDAVLLNQRLGEAMHEAWGEGVKPYRCLGPIEDKLLVEMGSYDWRFAAPPVEVSDVDINKLRNSISHVPKKPRLYVHERCKLTRRQFENAVWNKSRNGFEAHKDDGRYELVTAGIFLRREVNVHHDPTPRGLAAHPALGITIPLSEAPRHSALASSVKRMFRLR